VPLDEPSWWYAAAPDARTRLLEPLARIYGWAAARRLREPARVVLPIPVICVGNFTAGGTGKTPLSIHIAEHFRARGLRPVFLTRGYGGRQKGPAWVDAGLDTARDVGDEPLLLAQTAPVMVARDRAAGAGAILAGSTPADVVVMDDGLQNPAVHKTLRIAVVDRRRGVGNGHVIPAGPLRAPLDQQLALVDAVVVNTPPGYADGQSFDAAAWLRGRFAGPVIEAEARPAGDTEWLKERAVVALAGIANPGRFFSLLESLGARLADRIVFRDHHAFTETDAKRLLALAAAKGARLVTTEKDRMRLIGAGGVLAELLEACAALPIRVALQPRDLERLAVLLDGAAAAANAPLSGRASS